MTYQFQFIRSPEAGGFLEICYNVYRVTTKQAGPDCRQAGFVPIIALVIIAVLGVGGGATVVAADNAKPGDLLFPLDTAIENIRVNLATSPETEVALRTQFAAERVAEVEDLLQARGVDAPGLDVALANLTKQKAAVADLVAQKKELKTQAKALDDLFDQKERELKAAIKAVKRPLKQEKERLEVELEAAIVAGDTARADQLRSQIAEIKAKLDIIEAQEEQAEEALEAEEERLEAQFEAEEEALEAKEEVIDDEEERIEQELENLKEGQEKKRGELERQQERVEKEREELKEQKKED